MKSLEIEQTTFASCVKDAQSERVVLTREGKPIAMIIGLEGMDQEQLELGSSDAFWKMITARRKQKALTRAELNEAIAARVASRSKAKKPKQRTTKTKP
jgi:antitoxin (DNA-binding transcriptional repressor) of toxin-antitoxin stability system